MSSFKKQFQLEVILKTTYGSVFQFLVALMIIFQPLPPEVDGIWIRASLIIVMAAQVIRLFAYWPIRKSEETLLKLYPLFLFFSYSTGFGWGMAGFTSLSTIGTVGVGISALVSASTIACGTTYTLAADLLAQRIYTALIVVPTALGLVMNPSPEKNWVTVCMLAVVVAYCVYLAKKQNQIMRLIYEQQDRIKVDLLAAREIQQSLLPQPNQRLGDFQIEVLYKPCEDLSGDFFEIHPMKDHILFYVADVTSHGTASAQVTFLLKGIFKNNLPAPDEKFDLQRFTRQLAIDYSSYRLTYAVSLFIAKLDIKTGSLEYISSNFPSPIMLMGEKTSIVMSGPNPLIDAMTSSEEYVFKTGSAEISKGNSLYIFTDGTYELRSPERVEELSYRQLSKVLVKHSSENWKEGVLSELKQFNGNQDFKDDLTIMRIHHQASELSDQNSV